jgi:glycosyltransferase involved in cell wall biosynthesis
MEKILIIIPAYNASSTLFTLIEQISPFIERENILVVDDGSSDDTFAIANESKVKVLQHKRNKGKGEALLRGFGYALENGYEAVITMDADLQHDPQFIPDFLNKLIQTSPDIIIGTRKIELKKMPFSRWLTNNLTSIIVSVLGGTKVRDSQSGYRLISAKVLNKIKLVTKKYDLESELLIKAGRVKFKIDSVFISTLYRGSRSFINPLVDTKRFIKLMWRSLWW